MYFTAFESRFEIIRSICMRSAIRHPAGLQRSRQLHVLFLRRNLELIHHVGRHFAQIEPRLLQHQLSRFGLRQQQQRAHDARKLFDVFERIHHRVAILFRLFGGEQRHFQLPADGRERRAQLVRDVGRKLPDLLEGFAQPLGHAVEAVDQVIQFVAAPRRGMLQGKIGAGDFLRGRAPPG